MSNVLAMYRPKTEWFAVIWKSTLPTDWVSSVLFGTPYVIRPHSFSAAGSLAARARAAGLKSAGLIWLFANGGLRVICRPLLHAGDAIVLKSPASMAGVGTNRSVSPASDRTRVP